MKRKDVTKLKFFENFIVDLLIDDFWKAASLVAIYR